MKTSLSKRCRTALGLCVAVWSLAAGADTGFIVKNTQSASGKSYGWPANFTFTQHFIAAEGGTPTELAINMGNNQNPYNMHMAMDVAGRRVYDHHFAGLKQRSSDWATSFPISGMTWTIRKGDVVTISLTPNTMVGMEPVLVDNPAWPRAELKGYGRVALRFYVKTAQARVTITPPGAGRRGLGGRHELRRGLRLRCESGHDRDPPRKARCRQPPGLVGSSVQGQ
jgi:hypothetical protein